MVSYETAMTETIKPWGPEEKEAWFLRQTIRRSYERDVVARLKALPPERFSLEQYGALTHDPARYPLYRVLTKPWTGRKPAILITGGVHGYEPSGITGALRFLEELAVRSSDKFEFAVYPCVSPLGYEIDHRWNRKAEDPNRNFFDGGTAEEALKLMRSVESLRTHFRAAVDLHETNQRDVELTRQRRARDGQKPEPDDDHIPEGFYLVLHDRQDTELGHRVIDAVSKVTPICAEKRILGYPSDQGIIVLDDVPGLCQGFARRHADAAMTTEIYPDKAPVREAEDAQLAAIRTALDSAD
jgi:hypothetical protein